MNILRQLTEKPDTLEITSAQVDVCTVSLIPALPIVCNQSKILKIDVEKIKVIDACGLAWLMNIYEKYSSLGLSVKFTHNKILKDAASFVGLKLPEAVDQEYTQKAI